MKKTVFKGVINGTSYDSVQEYNTKLTELLEAGEIISASTKTETVETCDYCDKVDCTCQGTCSCDDKCKCTRNLVDQSLLYPYFFNDTYYLDELTDVNCTNDIESELNKAKEYIYSYLKDENVSYSDKQEYLEKILDIKKAIAQDKKYNDEATAKLLENRNRILKIYNTAKENYIADIRKCDIEDNVLGNAYKIIDIFKDFYDDIAKRATLLAYFPKEEVEPEVSIKENKRPKVTDISELFNKVFGVTLDDLKQPY